MSPMEVVLLVIVERRGRLVGLSGLIIRTEWNLQELDGGLRDWVGHQFRIDMGGTQSHGSGDVRTIAPLPSIRAQCDT